MHPERMSDNGAACSARVSVNGSGYSATSGVRAASAATVFRASTTNVRTGNRDAAPSLGTATEGFSSDLGSVHTTQTRENRVRVER
jgi:hypothetical protein